MADEKVEKQEYYYHACSMKLGVGSIILPGNWGRIIDTYRYDNNQRTFNLDMLYRESILENVRQISFSKKPSRFDCVFLCQSEDGAKKFLKSTKRHIDLIYKVTLTKTDCNKHIADYNKVQPKNWFNNEPMPDMSSGTSSHVNGQPQQNESFKKSMEQIAKEYWQDQDSTKETNNQPVQRDIDPLSKKTKSIEILVDCSVEVVGEAVEVVGEAIEVVGEAIEV